MIYLGEAKQKEEGKETYPILQRQRQQTMAARNDCHPPNEGPTFQQGQDAEANTVLPCEKVTILQCFLPL